MTYGNSSVYSAFESAENVEKKNSGWQDSNILPNFKNKLISMEDTDSKTKKSER